MAEDKNGTPLRGDAAWRAAKQEISDRNDVARARGRERRLAADELTKQRDAKAARRELSDLPVQPEP